MAFDDIENDSIKNGNLVVIENDKQPLSDSKAVFFVWYRPDNETQYRILLKTFRTNKDIVKDLLDSVKKKYNECGLGKWCMFTGKVVLYKLAESINL